jgi:methanogenic corrinoid protein MtbC1
MRPLAPHLQSRRHRPKIVQNGYTLGWFAMVKTTLSPKGLGRAIGVSESSLKRWVDSGLLDVARTAGGHRRIQTAEAIRFIREQGFAVARPDALGLDDVDALEPGAAQGDAATILRRALEQGDAAQARGIALDRFLAGQPLSLIVDRLLAPAMRAIGDDWRHGAEGIAVEHRAADICTQILHQIRWLTPAPQARPVAVGGAPEDEAYVLPSLMAASVLATDGWAEVTDMSAHTPLGVLARTAANMQARLVWLALSAQRSTRAKENCVRTLREALDHEGCHGDLVVGGPALNGVQLPSRGGVYHAHSMSELAAYARGLRSQGGRA